jgi:pyruvate-ferredoxin/flavodoxin oxidoreductase
MRLTSDKLDEYARELLDGMAKEDSKNKALYEALKSNPQKEQAEIETQRQQVSDLKKILEKISSDTAKALLAVADYLIKRSVWVIGGDGWAYDIGYGGLDHVIASGKNINLLVLDTEVYSNTGGQMSKATPIGAVAKFAAGGKPIAKKDLGLMATNYGYVYVARVAMGANKIQTLKAFIEADAYDGPSLIIAYSHCINQGINMTKGMDQQKLAVESGMWPLFRYNPELSAQGQNPFKLESKEPSVDIADYMYNEIRFRSLKQMDPDRAAALLDKSRAVVKEKYALYKYLSDRTVS